MSSGYDVIANSSSGDGLLVSLDGGKRVENFLNSQKYWYYAVELVLQGSYHSFEIKAPGLGDLSIFRSEWADESERILIAKFPRGSWEYVRMIPKETSKSSEGSEPSSKDIESQDYCPEGCRIRGWADLGEETKAAHMEFLHTGKIRKSPFD